MTLHLERQHPRSASVAEIAAGSCETGGRLALPGLVEPGDQTTCGIGHENVLL
jgi:hypothetical protein